MAYNDWYAGTLLGWLFGLLCSIGFSIFAVSLRWRPDTPKFTTIIIAGLTCALFSIFMITLSGDDYSMPLRNILLSMLHLYQTMESNTTTRLLLPLKEKEA